MSLPALEEKLFLLENWIQDEPEDEDLQQKHEEYLSLLEEVDILGKKMRKTVKLLQVPNQPNTPKLEKKKDQYEREFQEIVNYVTNDPFFNQDQDDEEDDDDLLPQEVRANSLLGLPLEMVQEMPGLEDSIATLNYQYRKPETQRRKADVKKLKKEVATLNKKLKKVEEMMENASTEKEKKKLERKHEEYVVSLEISKAELKDAMIEQEEDNESSVGSIGTASIQLSMTSLNTNEKEDVEDDASIENLHTAQSPSKKTASPKVNVKALKKEVALLQKKLGKVQDMIEDADTTKEIKKLQKKQKQYLEDLQIKKEKLKGAMIGREGEHDSSIGSLGASSASISVTSVSQTDSSFDFEAEQQAVDEMRQLVEHQESREQLQRQTVKEYVLLKKKLRKTEKLISKAKDVKEKRKLAKKQKQYLREISQYEMNMSSSSFGVESMSSITMFVSGIAFNLKCGRFSSASARRLARAWSSLKRSTWWERA